MLYRVLITWPCKTFPHTGSSTLYAHSRYCVYVPCNVKKIADSWWNSVPSVAFPHKFVIPHLWTASKQDPFLLTLTSILSTAKFCLPPVLISCSSLFLCKKENRLEGSASHWQASAGGDMCQWKKQPIEIDTWYPPKINLVLKTGLFWRTRLIFGRYHILNGPLQDPVAWTNHAYHTLSFLYRVVLVYAVEMLYGPIAVCIMSHLI